MFKDKDKQRDAVALCRHCGKRLELVPGKVQRQFCSDTHRKAYKRVEQRTKNAPESSMVDEPRTNGVKLPTSDNTGQQPRTGVNLEALGIAAVPNGRGGCKLIAPIPKRTANGFIRVSKPGDADYEPQCDTPDVIPPGTPTLDKPLTDNTTAKRGKDIKVFADLPPDIQEDIIRMTTDRNGKMDKIARAKRTAIAVAYQHTFSMVYARLNRERQEAGTIEGRA